MKNKDLNENNLNPCMDTFRKQECVIKPKMWRKRYIPNEIVDISKDNVIYRDEKLIVTEWNVIHPREDFQKGISYVMLDKGIKISKFLKSNGDFVKYYCDIIEVEYHKENDEYIFKDLLVDVEINSDNQVKILDMDELIDCENQGLITKEQGSLARERLSNLLETVNINEFPPKIILEYKL